MKLTQAPKLKIGTPFQRPSWRYEALQNPFKYSLGSLCTKKRLGDNTSPLINGAGYMTRLVKKGVRFNVTYKLPSYLVTLTSKLPKKYSNKLQQVWDKDYKKSYPSKIYCEHSEATENYTCWNLSKVNKLNDVFLKRLIFHMYNYKYDEDIDFAMHFWLSPENTEIRKHMGCAAFAGVPSELQAKRWQIPIGKIAAIVNIFFDYSHFPKDRMARWVMLKQMADIGEIDSSEFSFYRKIYDLGELGHRMQFDFHALSDEEKKRVTLYLGETGITSAINLNFAVNNTKDIVVYNKVMHDVNKLNVYKHEIRQKDAMAHLMEMKALEIGKGLNVGSEDKNLEDIKLIQALIKDLSGMDINPKYPSIIDIQVTK